MPVTIVCGPPCAGKNWHVEQHSEPGDTVIDWDAIAVELGSPRAHHHPKGMYAQVEAEYQRRLTEVEAHPPEARVWIIRGLPEPVERERWAARFGAEVVLLTPPLEVLMQRAQARRHPSYTEWAIRRWFTRAGATSRTRW